MNIVIISGSPRHNGISIRVALYLKKMFAQEHSVQFINLLEWNLPPMQTVYNSEENTPMEFRSLRQTMVDAEAFIFVTPEYNGGYSPAMKNLLDHFPKTTYARKAVGIVTASDGMMGGMRAAMQMQQLVCGLFGIPCPQMLITPQVDKKFDTDGNLLDPSFQRNIDTFYTEFNWLALATHSAKK